MLTTTAHVRNFELDRTRTTACPSPRCDYQAAVTDTPRKAAAELRALIDEHTVDCPHVARDRADQARREAAFRERVARS